MVNMFGGKDKRRVVHVNGKEVVLEPKPRFKFNLQKPEEKKKDSNEQEREESNWISDLPIFKKEENQVVEIPGPWKKHIQKVIEKHKGLETALRQKGVKESVYDYVKRAAMMSIMMGAVLGVVVAIVMAKVGLSLGLAGLMGFGIGFMVYQMSFTSSVSVGGSKGKKAKSKTIDRDILFATRDLIISLRSGMPLYNAVTSVSTGYGEASKEFAKITELVQLQTPLEDAIDKVVEDTRSKSFRRIMMQASVSIRAGADVVDALQSIINELESEREIELKAYGQRLNALAMFYMLFGVIMPSMGIAVITILTTFIALITVTPQLLYAGLAGILMMQVIFLQMIRSSRPVFAM